MFQNKETQVPVFAPGAAGNLEESGDAAGAGSQIGVQSASASANRSARSKRRVYIIT